MAKKLINPLDDSGIPIFKEPQWVDVDDYSGNDTAIDSDSETSKRKSQRKQRSDKGKPRKHYNKTVRQYRGDAAALQNTLKDIERFEKREKKSDSEAKSRAERYRQKRLQLLPNPRICPHCNKLKLSTKQWVIIDSFIGCKGCHWRINILPNRSKDAPHGIPPNIID